jgi:hypothetical protein
MDVFADVWIFSYGIENIGRKVFRMRGSESKTYVGKFDSG